MAIETAATAAVTICARRIPTAAAATAAAK